jgi:hypothetical protein
MKQSKVSCLKTVVDAYCLFVFSMVSFPSRINPDAAPFLGIVQWITTALSRKGNYFGVEF